MKKKKPEVGGVFDNPFLHLDALKKRKSIRSLMESYDPKKRKNLRIINMALQNS